MKSRHVAAGLILTLLVAAGIQMRRRGGLPAETPSLHSPDPSANLTVRKLPDRPRLPPSLPERLIPPIVAATAGGPASFVLRDRNVSAFFHERGVALGIATGSDGWGLHWGVADGRASSLRAEGELAARVNQFVGAPAGWKTDQPTFGRIVYDEVHPGISMVVEPKSHGLKYSLHARRGSDLRSLRLRYEGARDVRVVENGTALEVTTGLGSLREDGLLCFQDGRAVEARYVVTGPREYGFDLGEFDPEQPIVVDPYVWWHVFIGGVMTSAAGFNQASDIGVAVALDAAGNVYVAGSTASADFPTAGGFDTSYNGSTFDTYVAKIDTSGPSPVLAWGTYFGGSGADNPVGIVVDAAGIVSVAGSTSSADLPTPGGFDGSLGGPNDAFIARISASGSALLWATYLGGSSDDYAGGLARDAAGNLYIGGNTDSTDFPVSNGFMTSQAGTIDIFIARIDVSGPTLRWASYLGGWSWDLGGAVATDGSGNVYLTGNTSSSNFPSTGGFDTALGGIGDAFVAKINDSGVSPVLSWSTFLGGTSATRGEYGRAIAADGSGNVYVTGEAASTDFPTPNGFDTTFAGGFNDVFVAKVNGPGSSATLTWGTFLGGTGTEVGYGIAVDGSGFVYVTGVVTSSDFPAAPGYDGTLGGSQDTFVTKIDGATLPASIVWSTYLGGSSSENAGGIAIDGAQNVYVTGATGSADYPLLGAFDSSRGGMFDTYVTRLNAAGTALGWSTYLGGAINAGMDFGDAMALDVFGNLYVAGYTTCTDFPVSGGFDAIMGGGMDAFVAKVTSSGALVWSSYLGGTADESAAAIAVDASGNVYVTGNTWSSDFPVPNGFDTARGGTNDVFVAKIAPSGGALLWSSFLGGSAGDGGVAMAVNGAQNVVVAGWTASTDFPSLNGFDATYGGNPTDGFVTWIAGAGTTPSIVWSSYLGGNADDRVNGVALNASGAVVAAGYTTSSDFAVSNGFDATLAGQDAFVVSIAGSVLPATVTWSTFLGGSGTEEAKTVSMDVASNVYVAGKTDSTNFPAAGGFQTGAGGSGDGFVAKIAGAITPASLAWGSYLGGTGVDDARALALGPAGEVFVTGVTYSYTGFPTLNGFDLTLSGGVDAFVSHINPAGDTLAWSSYLGGSVWDEGHAIVTDGAGTVFVAGHTASGDLPGGSGFDGTLAGVYDAYVVRISPMPPPAGGGGGGGSGRCGTTGLEPLAILILLHLCRRRR